MKIICKLCGEDVGEFWSQLDEHMWTKHQDVVFAFLRSNAKTLVVDEVS